MPSPLNIPKTFTTDDAIRLKTELERQSQEIDRYLRDTSDASQPVPLLSLVNPAYLTFGQVARVDVPDGFTLKMQLPRPDPAFIGKRCGVRRSSMTGEVLIYAVGCLVGGYERYRMANDIHFVEFMLDGDFYPSRYGAGH
jgi:hypothetical protein